FCTVRMLKPYNQTVSGVVIDDGGAGAVKIRRLGDAGVYNVRQFRQDRACPRTHLTAPYRHRLGDVDYCSLC
ncbi:MAG: hypothetical protein AAGF35_04315, partial [Pseudomonadota bacterium]